MSKRMVSEAMKKLVAAKQKYKCANRLGSKLFRLEDYKCPMWSKKDDAGLFDESGYEIDHIIEHSVSRDDSEENLQALCISCHRVKTKKFNMSNKRNVVDTSSDSSGRSDSSSKPSNSPTAIKKTKLTNRVNSSPVQTKPTIGDNSSAAIRKTKPTIGDNSGAAIRKTKPTM